MIIWLHMVSYGNIHCTHILYTLFLQSVVWQKLKLSFRSLVAIHYTRSFFCSVPPLATSGHHSLAYCLTSRKCSQNFCKIDRWCRLIWTTDYRMDRTVRVEWAKFKEHHWMVETSLEDHFSACKQFSLNTVTVTVLPYSHIVPIDQLLPELFPCQSILIRCVCITLYQHYQYYWFNTLW